jgi:hypothetical protein
MTVQFENEKAGSIPCPAGTLTGIVSTIAGWDTINNPNDGVVGSNKETDANYYARYQEMAAGNASGSINALTAAVFGLDGVLDCVGVQNTKNSAVTISGYEVPANSYVLSVLGGDNTDIALQMLSKISLANQGGNTPITITDPVSGRQYTTTILRPTPLNYFFNVSVANQAGLPSDAANIIKEAIYNDFYNNRVRIGSTTYASRFVGAITSALPNSSVSSITMASQPEGGSKSGYGLSVVCDLEEYPELNKDNITINFV